MENEPDIGDIEPEPEGARRYDRAAFADPAPNYLVPLF
jgi:hypothetical protein